MALTRKRAAGTSSETSNASSLPGQWVARAREWLNSVLRGKHEGGSLKEALEEVLEEREEDGDQLPLEEETMIKNVLGFGDLAVADIMTPRTDIKAVEYGISLDALKEHITQHRHTRVPIYNDTLDNVKGFIHIKDLVPLLAGDTPFSLALILRDVLFVPPSMKLLSLLLKMRVSGVHIAMVIDEYGGTDGLVTLEDLFEEIVGDIQDEHDEEDPEIRFAWSAHRTCDVPARALLERLEPQLSLTLKPQGDVDFDTLGGLIFSQLGRVPARGEVVDHPSGARFEILAADARRIHRIRIYAPPAPEPVLQRNAGGE